MKHDDDDDRDDCLPTVSEPVLAGLVDAELPEAARSGATPWQEVVAAFLDAAIDSVNTRLAYERNLRLAFAALGVETVDALTGAMLARYRAQLTADPSIGHATRSQRLASLRSFLIWSGVLGAHRMSGDAVHMALRTPRGKVQRPYSILSESELGALLAAAECMRDRAVLAVFVGGGLRLSEVGALDCTDLYEDRLNGGLVLHVRQGKGRRDRQVPVNAEVDDAIAAYLRETGRKPGDPGPLFRAYDKNPRSTHERRRFSIRGATFRIVKRAMLRAGLGTKYSPHSLRHTFAIRALRAGASVVAIQKLLGHSSLNTTMRYLDHLELSELRAAIPTLPTNGTPKRRTPK